MSTVTQMTVSDPEPAFAAVGSGECDLGIVIADTGHEHPHVRCEPLGREEIVLVVPPSGLAEAESRVLADLADLPLVAPPSGSVGASSSTASSRRAACNRGTSS